MWQQMHQANARHSLRRGGAKRSVALYTLILSALAIGVVPTVANASTPHSPPHMTWRQGARIHGPHLEGAAVAFGKNVYDISGSIRDCSDHSVGPSTRRVDIYDTATNAFLAPAAPIPHPRQGGPAAVVVGHMIYVIGGITNCTPGTSTVTNIDMYNVLTNRWNVFGGANPAPGPLPAQFTTASEDYGRFMCGASIGSDIYFFGFDFLGQLNTGVAGPPAWTVFSVAPPFTNDTRCVRVGNHILIITGSHVYKFTPGPDLNLIGKTATLHQLGFVIDHFGEESAGLLCKEVVIVGGDDNNVLNGEQRVDMFNPNGGPVTTDAPLLTNAQVRDDSDGGAVVGHKFYEIGGQNGSNAVFPQVLIGSLSNVPC
jgi:hypothetical protein